VSNYAKIEEADSLIYAQFEREFASVKQWHEAKAVLNDRSLYDTALILEGWTFTPDFPNWDISHPLSGTFTGESIPTDAEGRPRLLDRLRAIARNVLLPTTWAFADSPDIEQLRVWCVPVDGASHYNVYNDYTNPPTLLGPVPNAGKNTLAVLGSSYKVRIAPVSSDGTIGILSNSQIVTVEGSEVQATAFGEDIVFFETKDSDTPERGFDRTVRLFGRDIPISTHVLKWFRREK
jgi:hypothetical protein